MFFSSKNILARFWSDSHRADNPTFTHKRDISRCNARTVWLCHNTTIFFEVLTAAGTTESAGRGERKNELNNGSCEGREMANDVAPLVKLATENPTAFSTIPTEAGTHRLAAVNDIQM